MRIQPVAWTGEIPVPWSRAESCDSAVSAGEMWVSDWIAGVIVKVVAKVVARVDGRREKVCVHLIIAVE